jgi:hypothetical protein
VVGATVLPVGTNEMGNWTSRSVERQSIVEDSIPKLSCSFANEILDAKSPCDIEHSVRRQLKISKMRCTLHESMRQ